MKFVLPELNYKTDALEPYIDQKTMEIHHQKHHGAYVNNLNAALEGKPEFESMTIEELLTGLDKLPESIRGAVRNNGGGHYNHTLFWESLTPGGKSISPEFESKLNEAFGSLEAFKAAFKDAALKRFGSGWAWLVSEGGKLKIVSTPNQDAPISDGLSELLGLDVWEHAYYLNYQNRRADYIEAFWSVVDWSVVEGRL
ncbi:MAG: superoxide dismutase [Clostridiales bacterium 38-18]|nr:MAG: superoxide dismutase [Clostridiales bacterium 38-18]